MKACFKCGEKKSLSDFYAHKGMKDGHLNKCKECTKKDVSRYRGENIERIRAYDRSRGYRNPPGYIEEYRKRFPEKYKAHYFLTNAVRDGKIARPTACTNCGSNRRIEGHHEDYSKPLEVIWLCAACHKQHHARGN